MPAAARPLPRPPARIRETPEGIRRATHGVARAAQSLTHAVAKYGRAHRPERIRSVAFHQRDRASSWPRLPSPTMRSARLRSAPPAALPPGLTNSTLTEVSNREPRRSGWPPGWQSAVIELRSVGLQFVSTTRRPGFRDQRANAIGELVGLRDIGEMLPLPAGGAFTCERIVEADR